MNAMRSSGKKTVLSIGGIPIRRGGFTLRHTGVICLKLGAVLKNVGSFVIKLFAFFGKNQSVSLPIEKADAEFNFQVADSNGHSG